MRVVSIALLGVLLAACASEPEVSSNPPQEKETPFFLNIGRDLAYTGDAVCATCHEDLFQSYQTHGMANSIYRWTPERAIEPEMTKPIYHASSRLVYRAYRRKDRLVQEELRLDSMGTPVHHLMREVIFVIGSGTAARTYLTERNHYYYEMPLTFYTQRMKWDFSPGYAEVNGRFNRLIPPRCIACHNSYPEAVPFVEGKYLTMPEGIGCERCHGPGSLHVEERLAEPEPPDSIDRTIVNPARLPLELRLDVCQQCHLHGTVSILREGREAFDFRPGEPLAAHMALFVEKKEQEGTIDVISHADRMKQSACFIGSLNTARPMDCTTCHNPHEGFRQQGPAYFNRTCLECHSASELPQQVSKGWRATHTPEANCISCHMPKTAAEDAPHSAFTDHWIRVVRDTAGTHRATSTAPGALEPYFERDREGVEGDMYLAMAYIVYGKQKRAPDMVEKGVAQLRAVLARDSLHGEAQYLTGFALMGLGRVQDAIPYLERAVRLNASIPERLNALAQAYEQVGKSPVVIERLYRRALRIQPALSRVRVNYGRFLQAQGRVEEAIAQYRAAIEEEPWLDIAYYNLGTAYLQQQAWKQAVDALKEAIRLNPDYAEAMSNLGVLYAFQGEKKEALKWLRRAVEVAPNDPVALNNLASFYLNEGKPRLAIPLLEKAVTLRSDYVDALVNLALGYFQVERFEDARRLAERVLRQVPDHPKARQILHAL